MNEADQVTIERVPAGETSDRETVERVARGAFPRLQAGLIELTPHVHAARRDGEIVGGTIAEILEPTPDERVGLVTWIFTDERARGIGAGKRLLEETVAYLEARDCDVIFAIVEWRNTSSSKLFATQGFDRTSAGTVADAYGLRGATRLWWTSMYWPAPGYDPWTRGIGGTETAESPRLRSAGRLAESAGVNAALFAVAAASLLGLGTVTDQQLAVLGVPLVFLAVRYVPTRLATLGDADAWRYWSWGNVYPVPAALSLLGLFVPAPGNLAPERSPWTYGEKLDRLGPAAAASAVLTLFLYGTALLATQTPGVPFPDPVAAFVLSVAWAFVLLDVVLPAWPFDTYNARVVYDWNRTVWGMLAAAGALLLGAALLVVLPLP